MAAANAADRATSAAAHGAGGAGGPARGIMAVRAQQKPRSGSGSALRACVQKAGAEAARGAAAAMAVASAKAYAGTRETLG